jgi:aspartyl-tRNA(Asn)/glutamyl-tRNA(Gln) amidotransferase subunit A
VSSKSVSAYAAELDPATTKKYKIAYIASTMSSEGLQKEISDNLTSTLKKLSNAGHQVESVDFPLVDYFLPTYYILATAEASSNLSRYDGVRYGYRSKQTNDLNSLYKKTRSEGYGKEVQRRILLGTFVLSSNYYDAYYTKAQKARRIIRDKTKELFQQYDFLIMPTTPTTAFTLGEHRDNPVEMYLADVFSVHANVTGIPGISIPCGKDSKGLPIGMQIVADDFEESKLLAFSHAVMNLN